MSSNDLDAPAAVLAEYLGVDVAKEPKLVQIARDALRDLPYGWDLGVAEGEHAGIPYYIDTRSNKSVWNHPYEKKYKQLIITERKKIEINNELNELREMKWRMWVEGKELLDGGIEVPYPTLFTIFFVRCLLT